MKKVIIALLLVALFAAPVFAAPRPSIGYGTEIACDFTVAAGKVQFKQAGIFATAKYDEISKFFAEGRIGYVTTFKTNPAVNGVQIDAMVGNYSIPFVKGAVGLSTDLHIIDEKLTANWAIAAEVESSIFGCYVTPAANIRYVFANKTGVAPFSFGIGAALDFERY